MLYLFPSLPPHMFFLSCPRGLQVSDSRVARLLVIGGFAVAGVEFGSSSKRNRMLDVRLVFDPNGEILIINMVKKV